MKTYMILVSTLILVLCASCQPSPSSTIEIDLTRVPTPATYEEIIQYMQSDSIDERLEGLSATLQYPEKSAEFVPLIIRNLYYPYSSDVRGYAARILSSISTDTISKLPDLIYVMNNDDSIHVRSECAMTLGNLGDLSAVPYLVNNLNNSNNVYLFAVESAKSISKLTGVFLQIQMEVVIV